MDRNQNGLSLRNILVIGDDKLACTIAINLALGRENVSLFSKDIPQSSHFLAQYIEVLNPEEKKLANTIERTSQCTIDQAETLVIISTEYSEQDLKEIFLQLEASTERPIGIGVASDRMPLTQLQTLSHFDSLLFGMNWVLPAHHTLFLELIHNDNTDSNLISFLQEHSKKNWQKDPYLIKGEWGIRSKMISALTREAFFLVDNGYASLQDIDRACRNDAGTYLPFAGNFRYMDLMGTFSYGKVMQELNKELSTATDTPQFFKDLVANQHLGMKTKKGFYTYTDQEVSDWEQKTLTFSAEIRDIMQRYPFPIKDNASHTETAIGSVNQKSKS